MPKKKKAIPIVVFSSCFLLAAFAVFQMYAMVSSSGNVDEVANIPSENQTFRRDNLVRGQVTLQWDAVPNATSYNIYWSKSPGSAKSHGKKISNVAIPTTIKDLEIGATYFFAITAVNEFGESAASEEISYTVGEK